VGRRKVDQFSRAGTGGLVRMTDIPVAGAVGEPEVSADPVRDGFAPNGRHEAGHLNGEGMLSRPGRPSGRHRAPSRGAREARMLLTGPWRYALAVAIIWAAILAARGALTRSALISLGLSVVLGWVIWRISGSLFQFAAGSRNFRLLLASGSEGAQQFVRAILQLAIAASLLWLAWVRPGPWQYRLVIALALAFAISKSQWAERRLVTVANRVLVSPARYFTRQIGVLGRIQRVVCRVPAAAWGTISLLILLNLLIGLALLNTARLSFGFWAIHTKIAFIIIFAADVLFLKSALSAPRAAQPELSPNYVVAADRDKTDIALRSRRGGHAPGQLREVVPAPDKPRRFRRRRPTRLRAKSRAGVTAGAVVLALGWVGYTHPGPLLVLAVLVIGGMALSIADVPRQHAVTMLLAVALGIAAVDYLGWRLAVTNWQGWWIAVPLLCAETFGALHVLGFQFTVWPWPTPSIEPSEDPTRHRIFMLVATINEGVAILRPTLEGCVAAREKYLAQYPDGQVTIVVCNDGRAGKYPRWMEVEALANELGVRCLTRTTGGGAKAGNIENARREFQITGTALMAIFDADQVPKSDFLLKTVLPFADPKVGWVQTGQYYANLNNPVSRWADDQQSMFYNLLCPGKAALNAAFICGTNVVMRAAALDEIGGLPQDSVTEDFAASIQLHPRWRSIYLTDVLATGLGPPDVPSYLKQQGRWALGTLAVFRDHWRDILLPKKDGLRFGQRVQYFLAGTHYLCGLRDLVYVLSPVLFIFTGIPAVRTATLNQYLLHFLPYGVLGVGGMWYTARGMTGLRGIIIGFGSSPALIGSLVACVLRRKRPFAVTSKETQGRRSLGYLTSYVVAVLLCLAALAWATQLKGAQKTSLFISLLWIVYSLVLLSSFLWLARADLRAHALARQRGDAQISAKQPYPAKLAVHKSSLKPVLNVGLAALVASPVLFGGQLVTLPIFAGAAPPFTITRQQADAHYVGLSLPVQMLKSEPPKLAHDLGIGFSVIGRTQDIGDSFDVAWADSLAAQGARPWITLQFGGFGRHNQSPLTANLPAIYNGVDDSEIRRWAVQVRDYGKPVYLTVLLQADKNWAVSSGVANGGIPQDVPKAWLHIQSVFRSVGTNNVAWVWAPADPLHDQRFAPPPSTIDMVLQDFILYPGTKWGNPDIVLRRLVDRYPGKPLFVEVSVAGPPTEKAAWLAELGHALANCGQLYALVYHEGGPALKPTPAQAKSWSEASDPMSLAAWKRIVTTLRTAGSDGNLR